ncbi:aspartate kinase [Nanoarchaeota archaeon]
MKPKSIIKFGGKSSGNPLRIKKSSDIILAHYENEKVPPVIVLSAIEGDTDRLIKSIDDCIELVNHIDSPFGEGTQGEREAELIREAELKADYFKKRNQKFTEKLKLRSNPCEDIEDELIDYFADIINNLGCTTKKQNEIKYAGERMAIRFYEAYLNQHRLLIPSAISLEGKDIGMLLHENRFFGEARASHRTFNSIAKKLKKINNEIPLVAGYGGVNKNNEIVVYNRGGSDVIARNIAIAAKQLRDDVTYYNYTDVNGMYSIDPKRYKKARLLKSLSWKECAELACFGAKLHPRALDNLNDYKIPVRLLSHNTKLCDIYKAGTLISEYTPIKRQIVKSIAYRKHCRMITVDNNAMQDVPGFASRILAVPAKYGIAVNTMASSEISVSFTIPKPKKGDPQEKDYLEPMKNDLVKLGELDVSKPKYTEICVVGEGMRGKSKVASKVFKVVGNTRMRYMEGDRVRYKSGSNEMISQPANQRNITFVVDDDISDRIAQNLHKFFYKQ